MFYSSFSIVVLKYSVNYLDPQTLFLGPISLQPDVVDHRYFNIVLDILLVQLVYA